MQRYFFISCSLRSSNKSGDVSLLISTEKGFPNQSDIREVAIEGQSFTCEEAVVTSMFEFKNEEDYLNFKRTD